MFKGMGNLTNLYLSRKMIKYIDDDSFNQLEKISYLDLGYNNLAAIEPNAFRNL